MQLFCAILRLTAKSQDFMARIPRLLSHQNKCGITTYVDGMLYCQPYTYCVYCVGLIILQVCRCLRRYSVLPALPLLCVLCWSDNIAGVQVFEKVGVERVEVENGRVCGVRTSRGNVKCEIFVNCGGQVSLL